jgi:hypothetical protein
MTILDEEPVIVKPYLSYKLRWNLIWPMMVPEYSGVLIFHHDGTSDDLSASEAAAKYPGSRLLPEEMAEYFAKAYQLKDGVWNYEFTHKDMPDTPKLEGSKNQFPFLIPTDNGPVWYTAVEPYGTSKSAYMSYYINATDGSVGVYKFSEPLVGPERAETFVNNAFNTLKGTSFYEPRPMVKGNNFYWMLSASASGTPDVQFTALVDANTEDVIKLKNQSEVQRVVNGEDPHKVGEVVASSGTPSQTNAQSPTDQSTSDLSTVSDQELAQMLREAADRLEKQGK